MPRLLPINLSMSDLLSSSKGPLETATAVDLSPSIALLQRIQNGELVLPTDPKKLNEDKVLRHELSINAAAELGFPIGNFKADGSSSVLVQDYAKYREIADGNTKLLVGVTVRYVVAFKNLNTNIRINAVPTVAAAIQLGLAEASATFEVRGMSSRKISSLVPIVDKLDVEKYAEFSEAQKAIKDLVWDTETAVDPVVLAVMGDTRD